MPADSFGHVDALSVKNMHEVPRLSARSESMIECNENSSKNSKRVQNGDSSSPQVLREGRCCSEN